MATFVLSENELKALGRRAGGKSEYNSRGYALIEYGSHLQHHIRLGDVTRTQQAMATGPIQGARSNLAGTL